eukprot:jgi/Ulvmu1/6854/UM031_0059.1
MAARIVTIAVVTSMASVASLPEVAADAHSHITAPSGADSDHQMHDMAASVDSHELPACASDPTDPECESYVYPDDLALADAKTNCQMMPFMVGCNVLEACENGDMDSDSQYCRPFDILATTCIDPGMSGMGGCHVYTPLCLTRGSVVAQCDTQPGVPRLVGTTRTQVQIVENCGTHSMPGCEDCTSTGMQCANTLRSLQTVCNAHRMEMCAQYNAMCGAAGPDLDHFCAAPAGTFDPPMRMYFHNGIRDIIWFRSFVPENDGEYAGALLLCFFVGVLASGLRVWRATMETADRIMRHREVSRDPLAAVSQSLFAVPAAHLPKQGLLAVLSFVVLTLDYALMLVAMTFNTGIFFAVVLGLTVGIALFRTISQRHTERLQAQSMLNSPPCGCNPKEVGYESIAAGRCCERASEGSGRKLKAHRATDGDADSGANPSYPPRACCSVSPLLDADLAEGNPDVAPACCA